METITEEQFFRLKYVYIEQIINGAVFIYPTDTIYGIGCDATNDKAVKKIREIKNRDKKPFSIIAPSKRWIKEYCIGTDIEKNLRRLPGAYTFVLKIKKRIVTKEVNKRKGTIGVRIPKHWISDFVKEFGRPIVTTSLNVSGELPVKSIDQISTEMYEKIDFVIDEGKLAGEPSTVIDLTGKEKKLR